MSLVFLLIIGNFNSFSPFSKWPDMYAQVPAGGERTVRFVVAWHAQELSKAGGRTVCQGPVCIIL